MSAALVALVLAAAQARAPLPFTPIAARSATAAGGRVVEVVRDRAYLDAGAQDGLAKGQRITLRRAGRPAASCLVEEVADRVATCAGEGLRAGDAFDVSPPPATAPPAAAPPPLGAEEAARRRAAIDAAALGKVTAAPLPRRAPARGLELATGVAAFVGGSVTRHEERVLAAFRGAPVGRGLRLDADLSARLRSAGADASRLRTGDAWLLELRELALSPLERGGELAWTAGRFIPWGAPGAGRIDGAQAALRRGVLECGAFAGGVPDPVTTEPTVRRATAGVFVGAGQGRPGLFAREEARVAWVRSPELSDRLEAEGRAAVALARTLDLSGRARLGVGGDARATGALDEARLDLVARLPGELSLSGGVRYVGLELPALDPAAPVVLPGPSRRGDVALSWAARSWLGLRLQAGGVKDVESGLSRAFAGPEISAWLFRRRVGLFAGYLEETGWLSGRTLWVGGSSSLFRAVRFQVRGTLTMDEREAPLPAELGAGGTGGVEWDLSPWLALRFSALVRTSISTGRDLGGRGFVELAARR